MAIPVPDLATLDPDEVQQAIDYVAARVGEYTPGVATRRGVVREIVIHLAGVFGAAAARVIEDRVEKAASLKKITEDPAGADPELVDRVLSNFRVARRPGGAAAGPVAVVVSRLAPVTVPKGLRFVSAGQGFAAASAFAARTTAAAVVTPTDRPLRPTGDGEYVFTVDVAAEAAGAAGQLRRGAVLAPQTPIPGFVRAYAEADFTGGADADSNADLLARLEGGLADRSASNRVTIDSMVRSAPGFERVLATSTVGFGDAEQRRYHSLLPVAFGGRIDVYARTQALPQTRVLTKTATLVEATAAGGVWQFALGRDDAPGFYEVRQVVAAGQDPGGQAGYEVTAVARGVDLTADGTGLTPDVETAEEAAFTRFQTAVVRFLDTETDTAGLAVGEARKDYDVAVAAMPLVAELQAFLADRGRRPGAADVLAKAPVPCFLSVNFTVVKAAGQADPDLGAIRTDLAAYVNGLGFAGRLSAGALAAAAHARLLPGQTLTAIDMFGRIVRPDGQTRYVRSDEALLIPDWPDKMVTPRTAVFLLDPASVAVGTAAG